MEQRGPNRSELSWLARVDAGLFRPREVLMRTDGTVRLISISAGIQRFAAALVLIVTALVGVAANSYRAALQEIDQRTLDVVRLQDDHRTRLEELGEALARATERGRAEAAEAVAGLIEQRNRLTERMAEIEHGLAAAENERERAIETHEGLMERLRGVEARLAGRAPDAASAAERVAALERVRIEALAERGRLAVEARRLALEHRATTGDLASLREVDRDAARAQDAALAEITGSTRAQIDAIARVLRTAGLQPERVLGSKGRNAGGPFVVPANERATSDPSLLLASLGSDLERLRDMRAAIRRLPLRAPLDEFNVMSPFGMRRDPFNGQLAMHSGIDLSAPSRTPVLATAAGKVVTAGWSGEYGNLVEIEHDFGLSTRYGHLTRIDVRVGQRIERRQSIGLLGSTGRSTGPHVHYEVLVDGRPVDPIRFLEAARNVRKVE
ncbi:MAG: peptidoglycan DD-metalloendopeptidase family protein [Alphaproteobacteria bacterium]|nr:peptidoglycan DD-metalloendopeptidase family protein [Alphaproteobacteria bacterium]